MEGRGEKRVSGAVVEAGEEVVEEGLDGVEAGGQAGEGVEDLVGRRRG